MEAVAGVTWEWPGWGAVTIGIIWTELDWPLVSKPASPWRPCAGEQGVVGILWCPEVGVPGPAVALQVL